MVKMMLNCSRVELASLRSSAISTPSALAAEARQREFIVEPELNGPPTSSTLDSFTPSCSSFSGAAQHVLGSTTPERATCESEGKF